eukprot:gene7287-5130_t
MLSSVFLLSAGGDVIVQMNFSESMRVSDLAPMWGAPPVCTGEGGALRTHDGIYSTFVRRNNAVALGAVRQECLAGEVVRTLQRVVEAITFFLRDFTEDTLRDNFATVYQILQEMLDYGYPLTSYLYQLEQVVPKPTLENKVRQMLDAPAENCGGGGGGGRGIFQRPSGLSGSLVAPWRDPKTRHAHSEILFDVVERVDCLMNSDGLVAHAAVRGAVDVDCRLNGTPEVSVRLSFPEAMKNVGLHPCVRVGCYQTNHLLSFIPPDGRFTLCQYTAAPAAEALHASLVPFYVTPQLVRDSDSGGGRLSCMVGWRGGGPPLHGPSDVRHIVVRLRLPQGTAGVESLVCSRGTARYARHEETITWRIDALGRTPPSLNGLFVLGDDGAAGDRQMGISAQVEFEMANYTLSRVGISSVQVMNHSAKFYKGVKYVTRAGEFDIRSA